VIEFHNVSKSFSAKPAVSELSFSVARGSITGLIGPNGSGKTTSLRMLLGLILPDRGSIELFGQPPGPTLSDTIGYLPEERGLYRRMTVRDALRFYCKLKNVSPSLSDIEGWLRRLQVEHFTSHKIEALSKGTAQKIQFIAAVLHAPELLILDEPFSGLDPVSSDVLRGVITEVVAAGTTVILSTHDMHVAEQLCDSILMLHQGQKVLDGTREQIRQRFGDATIKLQLDGVMTAEPLLSLPGVARVLDFRGYHELVLEPGADTQQLLKELAARARVHRFEVSTPSLHDLFARLAGGTE
jgi:ABC-2 type transport system ATP-binding protein